MNSGGESMGADSNRNGNHTDSDLVSQAISNWRNGRAPDALEFLKSHPGLADHKSLVLDLAYEEYCLRKEQGDSITPSKFCDKFPDLRRSLARLLDVHEYLDHHPEFVPVEEQIKWPQRGDVLLGFEIERKIGSGAFARVYVARDPSLGHRPVVLKVSQTGSSEAMTLGRLMHDNIVPVNSVQHDAETGLTAICMPYQGEATLVDLLEAAFRSGVPLQSADVVLAVARKHLANTVEAKADGALIARFKRQSYVDAVVGLGIRLAGALKYAHSRGVLHRDLKPSNILLAPDGEPKLLDFNLSWDTQLAGARLGGTVPYMSPEQVNSVLLGKPTDKRGGVDQRSDLFSLGVVLYELLTGVTPFGVLGAPGDGLREPEELLKRQRQGALPVEQLNPNVDASLGEVVMWCLQFDAADRPQSAAELEAALLGHQRPAARLKRALRRRRRMVVSAVIALFLFVAVFGNWVANRPSLADREYRAGLTAYREGNWEEAARRINQSIVESYPTAQVLFARAMTNIQRKKYEEAISDLNMVRQMSSSGAVLANLAYCNALLGRPRQGVYWSDRSLDQGFVNVAVFSNLRNCYVALDKPHEAKKVIDRTIGRNPNLACGYQYRALVELDLAKSDSRNLPAARKDIERAMELAPGDWSIQLDAARVFAHSSVEEPKYKQRSLQCLRKALDLGGSLTGIGTEKWLDFLRTEPEYALLPAPPQPSTAIEKQEFELPYADAVLR
jgi:serine/threonine protein kinase